MTAGFDLEGSTVGATAGFAVAAGTAVLAADGADPAALVGDTGAAGASDPQAAITAPVKPARDVRTTHRREPRDPFSICIDLAPAQSAHAVPHQGTDADHPTPVRLTRLPGHNRTS